MNYFEITGQTGPFSFSADLNMGNTDVGFHLAFVNTGMSPLVTGFAFSGISGGYIFDQSGLFVGGVRSGETLNINGNVDGNNKLSYFLNGSPCHNNISINLPVNSLEYSKDDTTSISCSISYNSSGVPASALLDESSDALLDETGDTLLEE